MTERPIQLKFPSEEIWEDPQFPNPLKRRIEAKIEQALLLFPYIQKNPQLIIEYRFFQDVIKRFTPEEILEYFGRLLQGKVISEEDIDYVLNLRAPTGKYYNSHYMPPKPESTPQDIDQH